MVSFGKIFRNGQNQDELDPLGRLEMLPSGHFDPASCPQIFLPEDHHGHQRSDGSDVHPVHLIEQRLVVDQAHHEHGAEAANDPIDLLDMRAGELSVRGGALDLGDAKGADQQDEEQQIPVEVAV